MNTHKPLAGVYVLDLSRFAPGGFCSLLLADLGADVVKVEAPNTGDGLRGMYGSGFDAAHIALNRGKRSIALDLRHHDAPRVLEKLVAQSAIVIDSHRPGQLDRFGLGYGAMAQANPPVVWCSITGFGDFGPNAQHPGHDLTYLGYGGLLSKLSDRDPTPPGTVVSIPLAATMASTGILAALHAAERTGQGTHLDVSMTDSAMWVRSEDIARAAKRPRPRMGNVRARATFTDVPTGGTSPSLRPSRSRGRTFAMPSAIRPSPVNGSAATTTRSSGHASRHCSPRRHRWSGWPPLASAAESDRSTTPLTSSKIRTSPNAAA